MLNTKSEDVDIKYILSPFYSFVEPSSKLVASHLKTKTNTFSILKKGGLIILYNKYLRKSWVINQTIYRFLSYFKCPKTISELISDFAKEIKCEESEISFHVNQFLSKMTHRKILIREQQLNSDNDFLTKYHKKKKIQRAVFRVNDQFKHYTIKSILSIRKETQLFILEDKDQLSVLKMFTLPVELPQKIQDDSRMKFIKEFKLLALLQDHSAICKLYHFDEESRPYAIMEYIQGKSLRNFILKEVHQLKTRLLLLCAVIDTIAFVQEKGILHGDIHNGNFIVDDKNQIKLIDFGLSNHVCYKEGEIIRNGAKSSFVPPERVTFNSFSFLSRPPDIRSEVFQLGVLGYFIVYQKMPFFGLTWTELANNIKTVEPKFNRLCSNNERIPPAIIQVLRKAMNKGPEMRYANARLLSNTINKVIHMMYTGSAIEEFSNYVS